MAVFFFFLTYPAWIFYTINLSRTSPVTRTAGTFHGKRVISHDKSVPCNRTYYIAESVFALGLVNLRPITYCSDQNFRSKCSFCRSIPLYLEKWFKESYYMFVNPVDLDVDFILPNYNLCLFENEVNDHKETES